MRLGVKAEDIDGKLLHFALDIASKRAISLVESL